MKWTILANGNVYVEDARIFNRNFSGEHGKYNNDRTFNLSLDEELGAYLRDQGWPVWQGQPNENGEQLPPAVTVKVQFWTNPSKGEEDDSRNPKVELISSRKRKRLWEDKIDELEFAEIDTVDMILRARPWTMKDGRSGVKPYLRSMAVKIKDDPLDEKYADIPYDED
jgi:hypothetical protein